MKKLIPKESHGLSAGTLYRIVEGLSLLVKNFAGNVERRSGLEIWMYLETTREYQFKKPVNRFWFLDSNGKKIGCAVYEEDTKWFFKERLEKVKI